LCDQKLIKEGPNLNKVILLQIAIKFIKELLEFFGNPEVRTLTEIEDKLSRIMKAFIRELIKAYIQITDDGLPPL